MAAAPDSVTEAGIWLRCALQAHTTRSDGEQEPGQLVQHYEQAGLHRFGIATDDSHHGDLDSRLAWVWAHVAERSEAAVLEALATASFSSSTGPCGRKAWTNPLWQ